MSRLLPLQGALNNLKGVIPEGRREYLPREEALEFLTRLSGEDFGYDVEALAGVDSSESHPSRVSASGAYPAAPRKALPAPRAAPPI